MSNKKTANPYLTGKVETLSPCARKVLHVSDMAKMPARTFQGVTKPYIPGRFGNATWSSSRPEWRIVIMARRLGKAYRTARFWLYFPIGYFFDCVKSFFRGFGEAMAKVRHAESMKQIEKELAGTQSRAVFHLADSLRTAVKKARNKGNDDD